jgi:hypothetical protein
MSYSHADQILMQVIPKTSKMPDHGNPIRFWNFRSYCRDPDHRKSHQAMNMVEFRIY